MSNIPLNKIEGKTFSELVPIQEVKDTALLVVDNGGTECNTISVSDFLKDIPTGEQGSGFDFEGTLAEFNDSVESGLITPESVSLITDDYDSENDVINEVLSQLNNKADLDLNNTNANLDYVVDSYSDDNGNWYRVYKSGWVEQGGITTATGQTTNLLKAFKNTNYSVTISIYKYTGTNAMGADVSKITKTTTSIKIGDVADWNGIGFMWVACGQGA